MSEIQTARNSESGYTSSSITPAVDIVEDGSGITLYADLPGVTKEKLNLRIEQDALIIEGGIEPHAAFETEAQHTEIDAPGYRRAFTLSKELDAEKISAQFANGVLKLHIPKAEHAQPKRIDISLN